MERVDNLDGKGERQNEISVFSTYAAREDRATLILLSFFLFFFQRSAILGSRRRPAVARLM